MDSIPEQRAYRKIASDADYILVIDLRHSSQKLAMADISTSIIELNKGEGHSYLV